MSIENFRVVVLISGNGSNLQALIDASADATFSISAVISNSAKAYGIQRASAAGIAHHVIEHTAFESREVFDRSLLAEIERYRPDLVVLAGFMRILSAEFVKHFSGRLINIHPSLLPKYTGMNTHQRVIDAGDKEHGASVHFVTEELDGGPVIASASIDVDVEDDADTLKQRIAVIEHQLYPAVVKAIASGRVKMVAGRATLDGTSLPLSGVNMSVLAP